MEINELLTSIPSIIGEYFENIYVVSKELDKSYKVLYTGDELKVSPSEKYETIREVLKDKLESIETIDTIKDVYTIDDKQKLISVKTVDKYKIIFITDITKELVLTETNKEEVVSEKKAALLIADDSPVITKFFTKTFENEYEIVVATNGDEAIDFINKRDELNIIAGFIDLQMPGKNGYDVLEYLKENDLFKSFPVSVISGEDSQDGIERATTYGIVDMLQKPFSQEAARSIVNKTISIK